MNFRPLVSEQTILILAIIAVLSLLLSLWKGSRGHGFLGRIVPWLLRICSLSICFFILLNPVEKQEFIHKEQTKESKVILIDKSRSLFYGSKGQRFEEAQKIARKLKKKIEHTAEVHTHYFDEALSFGPTVLANKGTKISSVLLNLLHRYPRLSDVYLISDGITEDKNLLNSVAEKYLSQDIKIHTHTVKAQAIRQNLKVINIKHPQKVEPREKFNITVTIHSENIDQVSSQLRLQSQVRGNFFSQKVIIKNGLNSFEIPMTSSYKNEQFKLSVDPLKIELNDKDNSLSFAINSQKKKYRVLYMEGSNSRHKLAGVGTVQASYFKNQAWKQDGNFEVDTLNMTNQRSRNGRLYDKTGKLKGFPNTKEELFTYDLIICSDITRLAFRSEQLDWVRELVSERGGGFIMIGGSTSFGDGGWDRTVWERLIPVDMKRQGNKRSTRFNAVFNVDEFNHPILRISSNRRSNKLILQQAFRLNGTNIVHRLKPGATALAYHSVYQTMPIIAIQPYGKGRTMAFTSDSAGSWGDQFQGYWGPNRRNNSYYKRFWVNASKWLCEHSLNHQKGGLVTELETRRPNLEEDFQFTSYLKDYKEGDNLSAEISGYPNSKVILTKQEQTGYFTGKIFLDKSFKKEQINLEITARNFRKTILSTDTLTLYPNYEDKELINLKAEPETLKNLSKLTQGKNILNIKHQEENDSKTIEHKLNFTLPMWDKWPFLITLLALFSTEWFLRKRFSKTS